MLTAHQHTEHIAHPDSCVQGKCVSVTPRMSTLLAFDHTICPLTHMCSTNFDSPILFKMADWTFEDALMAIQSLPSILTSILQSAWMVSAWGTYAVLRFRPTLRMHTVPIAVLEKWVEGRSFNPEHMAGR